MSIPAALHEPGIIASFGNIAEFFACGFIDAVLLLGDSASFRD